MTRNTQRRKDMQNANNALPAITLPLLLGTASGAPSKWMTLQVSASMRHKQGPFRILAEITERRCRPPMSAAVEVRHARCLDIWTDTDSA